MDHSTIAAIATPSGSGGVGIIKISGPDALNAVANIFCPGRFDKGTTPVSVKDPSFFSPWKIHYGHIVDPSENRVYDEVIVAVMPAPKSYTREDVVEIQAHGGTIILERIMSLLLHTGIRTAQPGEFTRRAFLNGRIDLAQAEAVIDLINARCDAAIDIAFEQASGSLSASIETIRSGITGLLASIEAMVDFPEAMEEEIDTGSMIHAIAGTMIHPVMDLVSAYEESRSLRDGFRVVIAGAPNVGKSSLLNRISGCERAIVTEHPGTTRDYIETLFHSGGIPITLVDTAGLRMDPDPVEKIGIEKARMHIREADLVLHVLDASRPVSDDDRSFFEQYPDKVIFIVRNKIDMAKGAVAPSLSPGMDRAVVLETSAKYNQGIEALKQKIAHAARQLQGSKTVKPVPNFRHKALLLEAKEALSQAIENLENHGPPELVSIDLRQAHDRLGEITGCTASPEVLDEIFSRYCIGK